GKQNNWNIQGYTKSACSPVPLNKTSPENRGAEREDNQACDDFVVNTAKEIENDPSIDVVATASLGSGSTYYLENGEAASDSEKINAIDTMWQGWSDAGKDVVVMGEVPHFDEIEAPTCVESNADAITDNCSMSFEDAVESRSTFQRLTASVGNADVKLYDPSAGMCEDGRCYSVVGNLITRYDAHHLSQEFAKSYTDDFAQFMREQFLK